MATETEPRVIKRYANRKLYDMQESCYITHDEIANLVKGGEDVQIIDNKTKEDLTTLTLTQILFREEKMQRKGLPLHALRGILQSGGDFIQRQITDPLQTLRDEAEETVRTISHVFRRDDEGNEVLEEIPLKSITIDAPVSLTARRWPHPGRCDARVGRQHTKVHRDLSAHLRRTLESHL